MRYVALGDSYTIGTSVPPAERWPDQLVAALGPDGPTLDLVANLGVNGYTSADLIRDEMPALDDLRPEFVTLLIGVNDVVQGVAPATYEKNVVAILDALLDRVPADRIVTVAIPDYTVTPAGSDYGDPRQQHDADRGRQRDHGAARGRARDRLRRHRSTSRSGPPTTARSSQTTGSTRAAPSTPSGWSGSCPSSRALIGR